MYTDLGRPGNTFAVAGDRAIYFWNEYQQFSVARSAWHCCRQHNKQPESADHPHLLYMVSILIGDDHFAIDRPSWQISQIDSTTIIMRHKKLCKVWYRFEPQLYHYMTSPPVGLRGYCNYLCLCVCMCVCRITNLWYSIILGLDGLHSNKTSYLGMLSSRWNDNM